MPAKGSDYLLPDRYQVLGPKLYKEYKEANPNTTLSYQEFSDIIKHSNRKIAETVVNDAYGFKMPENLGYLCVIRYKSRSKAINWADTKKYGKKIYYLNLHSFGYRYHIKWFKTGICRFLFNEAYKFAPLKDMRIAVSKAVRGEKVYHNWSVKDFWGFNKLEKLLHKKLKREEDESN